MSVERGGAAEEVQNMILVSCFIGRVRDIPIPNAFLEGLSRHSRDTYYRVRNRLSRDGLIIVRSEARNAYVELTERGTRVVSRILVGEETENLEWMNVYEAIRNEAWIFWKPIMRLEESVRHNLLQALLLLYSETPGDNPRDYFRNLLQNFVTDYRRLGADRLTEELLGRLDRLYDGGLTISRAEGRSDWENNVTRTFSQFATALIRRIDEVSQKAEISLGLGWRRRTTYLLCPIVTSYNTIVKYRLLPTYLALVFIDLLLVFAIIQPAIGLFLVQTIAYIGMGLGVFVVALFLFGAFMSRLLRHRASRREAEA